MKLIYNNNKSSVYDCGDKIVKKVANGVYRNSFECYLKLYEIENRLVKVHSWDEKTITMEKIKFKYSLEEYTQKYDKSFSNEKLNNYIAQFIDIWNNISQFSLNLNSKIGKYFINDDYRLSNVVVDYNENLRVLDPESFKTTSFDGVNLDIISLDLIRLNEVKKKYMERIFLEN